jgi:hypothetical protein
LKKILKLLGLAGVLATILVVILAGTVLAAPTDNGNQTQNKGEVCLCGECPSVNCVCSDCEPNEYSYYYNHLGSSK